MTLQTCGKYRNQTTMMLDSISCTNPVNLTNLAMVPFLAQNAFGAHIRGQCIHSFGLATSLTVYVNIHVLTAFPKMSSSLFDLVLC